MVRKKIIFYKKILYLFFIYLAIVLEKKAIIFVFVFAHVVKLVDTPS